MLTATNENIAYSRSDRCIVRDGTVSSDVAGALRGADLTQSFREMGWDALASTSAECLAFLQSERVKWGRVVKERGMRAD